jgi:hypothetical protein
MTNKKTNSELLFLLSKVTNLDWKIEITSFNGACIFRDKNMWCFLPLDTQELERNINDFLFNQLCSEIESKKRNLQREAVDLLKITRELGINEHE